MAGRYIGLRNGGGATLIRGKWRRGYCVEDLEPPEDHDIEGEGSEDRFTALTPHKSGHKSGDTILVMGRVGVRL
jgi:hypothetical protein